METTVSEATEAVIGREALAYYQVSMTGPVWSNLRDACGLPRTVINSNFVGWLSAKLVKDPSMAGYFVPVFDEDGKCRSARIVPEDLGPGRWATTEYPRLDVAQTVPRLLGIRDLTKNDWKTVVLCFSEFDWLAFRQYLEGASGPIAVLDQSLPEGWEHALAGRNVVVCMPPDGVNDVYVRETLIPKLMALREQEAIGRLYFPGLTRDGKPCSAYQWWHGGRKYEDFKKLATTAVSVLPREAARADIQVDEQEIVQLESLVQIDDPKYTDRRVMLPLAISGETGNIYDSPHEFSATTCPEIARYHDSGKGCTQCEDRTYRIDTGQAEHIAASHSSERDRDRICRDFIKCPFNKKPRIDVLSKKTLREMIATQYAGRIVEQGDDEDEGPSVGDRREHLTERTVFVVVEKGEPIEYRGYWAIGWIRTSPRDASRTFLVEKLDPIQEPYETFDYRAHRDTLERLKKLGHTGILEDLTNHRTLIFGRDELLLLVMLTYCSVLRLRFNGEEIRGWLTVLLLGASGGGKSKIFQAISKLLGVGDIFSCLTGRRTGLTYATVRTANSWRCQAGAMSRNDGKVLCVEEAQDMPMRDIKTMADGMDRGFINPENVASGRFDCRTRIVFNSNAKNNRTVGSYPFGCMAVKDLFDFMFVRRLDVCAIVSRIEDHTQYNKRVDTKHDPIVSAEDLRTLIFYAWSLKPGNVRFSEESTQRILDSANELSRCYGGCEDIPLVCPSDIRQTLARLSAALAVLDLSSSDGFATVDVRPEHVDKIVGFLAFLYSDPNCALDQYSDLSRRRDSMEDYDLIRREVEARIKPKDALAGEGHFAKLLYLLLRGITYRKADICRLMDSSERWITNAVTYLETVHLVRISKDERLSPTPKFNRFMKRFKADAPEMYGIVSTYRDSIVEEESHAAE